MSKISKEAALFFDAAAGNDGVAAAAGIAVALQKLIDERDAALATHAKLQEWTHTFGAALHPTGADTFGEGMRAAKAQVSAILAKYGERRR